MQLGSRGGLMGSDLILTGGEAAGGGVEELTLRWGRLVCDIPNELLFHWCRWFKWLREISALSEKS